MASFIDHLKLEHQRILRALDVLELLRNEVILGRLPSYGDSVMLLFLLRKMIEDVHHKKEEEILFKELARFGQLEGGPRCTHFMGQRLEFDPAEKILAKSQTEGSITATFSSALDIPLEEHRAGHLGLMMIGVELKLVYTKPERAAVLVGCIEDYLKLMRAHIEKEDTCLFEMANRLLDEEVQMKMRMQAATIDNDSSFSMDWVEPTLERLKSSFSEASQDQRKVTGA